MQSALDNARAQLRAAEAALQELDVRLEAIHFDPVIPSTVEKAIGQTLEIIDELLVDFRSHPVLEPMVAQLKAQYLENIQSRATSSHSSGQRVRWMSAVYRVLARARSLF